MVAVNEDFLADGQPQVLATHDFMNMDSVTAYYLSVFLSGFHGRPLRRLIFMDASIIAINRRFSYQLTVPYLGEDSFSGYHCPFLQL